MIRLMKAFDFVLVDWIIVRSCLHWLHYSPIFFWAQKTCKFAWAISAWYILGNANAGDIELSSIINQKVLSEKIFSYSILESFRHQLLDSEIKSRLFHS